MDNQTLYVFRFRRFSEGEMQLFIRLADTEEEARGVFEQRYPNKKYSLQSIPTSMLQNGVTL